MKTKFILALLFVTSFGFTKRPPKKFIPPGTVQITETFFVDDTEINNFSWVEYLFYTAEKYGSKSQEYLSALPDTLVWKEKYSYNEPYVSYYLRHSAYRDYPVVGISHEQALSYCKWRTERVKEYYAIKYKKEFNGEYRLPTKEEWEFISNNMWWPVSKYFNPKDTNITDVTNPVNSSEKNYFGLYNMFGNVAEMISEKGIAKGGSWYHAKEDCRAGKDIPYTKPEAWLGFRCVCVVKQ